MDSQYIALSKHLLLARCVRLESLLESAREDPSRARYAEIYADKLLNLTPRDAFFGSDFDKIEMFLDHYSLAIHVENYEWARRSIQGIETLAAWKTECISLF